MCISPLSISNKGSQLRAFINVPCGKCPKCKKRKISDITFRLEQHLKVVNSAYFITFTYNDKNLPYGDNEPTLVKKDMQNFMKRLRNYYPPKTLSYFIVGEYGSKNKRPHYHALLFNADPMQLEEHITLTWKLGFTYILPLKNGGIPYVAKYMNKEKPKLRGKENEFQISSQNLGLNYLDKETIAWHKQSAENCYIRHNSFKKALPRYYKKKIYDESEFKAILSHTHEMHKQDDQKIKVLAQKHKKNVNEMLNLIDYRNQRAKLPPRNETL